VDVQTTEQRLTVLLNDPITRLVNRNVWFQAKRVLLMLRSLRLMEGKNHGTGPQKSG
jgi:hypothetical protein